MEGWSRARVDFLVGVDVAEAEERTCARTRCTARLADGEVEMPKEECRWIEEREEDPMAEGGRVFGVWDWRCRWRLPLAGGG